MKYKHKPIPENDRVVDAILHDGSYIVVRDGLPNLTVPQEEFEGNYEPLKREPRSAAKAPKKKPKPTPQA